MNSPDYGAPTNDIESGTDGKIDNGGNHQFNFNFYLFLQQYCSLTEPHFNITRTFKQLKRYNKIN